MKMSEVMKKMRNPEEYLSFDGYASRSEFWFAYLLLALPVIVIGGLALAIGYFSDYVQTEKICFSVTFVLSGFLYLGLLPVLVRRLNDLNLPRWIALACLAACLLPTIGAVAGIATIVIGCMQGKPEHARLVTLSSARRLLYWATVIAIIVANAACSVVSLTWACNDRMDHEIKEYVDGY